MMASFVFCSSEKSNLYAKMDHLRLADWFRRSTILEVSYIDMYLYGIHTWYLLDQQN